MEIGNWITILSTVILGLFGLGATIFYSQTSTNRENDKIFKELFTEFNARYDALNNKLGEIVSKIQVDGSNNILLEDKMIIIDYFNLCAEEYFWYKKGRIDEKIWKSWNAGMNYWHRYKIIQELWGEEINEKDGLIGYYINNGDEFFNRVKQ